PDLERGKPTQPTCAQQSRRLLPQLVHLGRRSESLLGEIVVQLALELEGVECRARYDGHRGTAERRGRNLLVEGILRDAHAPADDGTADEVELGDLPSQLDRLLVRQPVPAVPQPAVEGDVDVIEPSVDV